MVPHAVRIRRFQLLLTLLACVSVAWTAAAAAAAGSITIDMRTPTLDRWMYPFNGSPGTRPNASTFTALGSEEFEDVFDNRDAQFLVGFDTGALVEPGLGPARYQIHSARLIATISDGGIFPYDPTYDTFTTYLPAEDPDFTPDDTPGRPIELYGVGFRNGFTAATFLENSPFGQQFGQGLRNAFATDVKDGVPRDVSNNVRDRFDPTPFAIGQTLNAAPGQIVPTDAVFNFDLDLNNPDVVAYLQAAMNDGRLRLLITSLHPAEGGPGGGEGGQFPIFYTKENKFAPFDDVEPALELVVEILPESPQNPQGDINGDGVVNSQDLAILLGSWGVCPPEPDDCPADVNGDGVVNSQDLAIVLGNWGATAN
ncbi:MAG: hypothetical protein EA376_09995 [Phycisphaeraceae bacterium]|nr:MAG: hypothetical protein EA376_09995 [Phycisphaeraceae bacterium]